MATYAIKNAGGVPFLILKGFFVVRSGQMPDGDTVAFAAGSKFKSKRVRVTVPVSTTGKLTTNIRFQSIDAPEKSQPHGARARDALLTEIGFVPGDLGLADDDFTADDVLEVRAGWIATHGMDHNDRPLGYVFAKSPGFAHGTEVSAADLLPVITKSVNYTLARSGAAFPAYYSNTEESHAVAFQAAANEARKKKMGVWTGDLTTTGFVPTKEALGPSGSLVYPKIYRRVIEWKQARPDSAAFLAWIKKQSDGKKLVFGAAKDPVPFSDLFVAAGKKRVAVPYDVNKLWFSE